MAGIWLLPFPWFCWNPMSQSSLSRATRGCSLADFRESQSPGEGGASDLPFRLRHFLSPGSPGLSSLGLGPPKRETGLITPGPLIPADERDLEDFLLDLEEDLQALHSVQCSPSPGEEAPGPPQQQHRHPRRGRTSQPNLCRLFCSSVPSPGGSFPGIGRHS